MEAFQAAFVELLVEYEVIRFGSFTLKSGRTSPYFVNAGQLRTGDAIARLGAAYAAQLQAADVGCDVVFGPSYKGVPLAVATATALSGSGRDVGFSFDRKEAKDHGEGGTFVGTQPVDGMRVVVVDDVITSGRSIRESVALLQRTADVQVVAVVVAVDRQEKGKTDRTTLAELRDELGVAVLPVVSVRAMVDWLREREVGGRVVLDRAGASAIDAYLAEYGGVEA
ncbi:MAG: orotate phosphoribosyltransferase [Nannocystaceae bacterium]|nr:orotate phosphoribosyltransferase [bacterium]